MNNDLIALRISQLQTLHEELNNVLMDAKKMVLPQISSEWPDQDGIEKLIAASMLAIKNELDFLRKQL